MKDNVEIIAWNDESSLHFGEIHELLLNKSDLSAHRPWALMNFIPSKSLKFWITYDQFIEHNHNLQKLFNQNVGMYGCITQKYLTSYYINPA